MSFLNLFPIFFLSLAAIVPGSSVSASAQPCELRAVEGGVACVLADDDVVVEILHPTLFGEPRSYRERRGGVAPAGPVEFGGVYYYGVKHDLMRFDPNRRAITGRVRMPVGIGALDVDGSSLVITAVGASAESIEIRFEPGQEAAVGRGPWDFPATMGTLQDVMWLDGVPFIHEPGATREAAEVDREADEALLELLDRREALDQTNPYLPLYRGEALQRLGRSEEASRAFATAANHVHADWLDALRIGTRLEYRGQTEEAGQAFERASVLIGEAGIRGEYVTGMVNVAFVMIWFRDAMEAAISSGDLEGVDRLAGYLFEFFPNLEGTSGGWRRLEAYFSAHGDPARAERWNQRAEEAGQAPRPDQLFEEAARAVDLFLLFQTGLLIALLFSGAILGLWRRDEEEGDEGREAGQEWRAFLPRFSAADLVMVALIMGALVLMPINVAPRAYTMATWADIPPAATGDALGAPAVSMWLSELESSRAASALIEESGAEFDALRAGGQGEGEADINALLIEAVEADTRARGIRSLADVEISHGVDMDFPWLGALTKVEFTLTMVILILMIIAMNALILGGLLQAVARRSMAVQRWATVFIVGAPNSLGIFRIPTFAAFVVGLAMLSPISQIARLQTEQSLATYIGLGDAPAALGNSTAMQGALLVGLALTLHVVGLIRDRRS